MQKAKMTHPYIVTYKRISGGSPVIKGNPTQEVDIAIEYEYQNHTP